MCQRNCRRRSAPKLLRALGSDHCPGMLWPMRRKLNDRHRGGLRHTKARPGKVNFASPGIGSTIQLCGELFKIMTGVNMVHVPYRGNAPALTDLIAGQVQVMFADAPSSIEHLKAGKRRCAMKSLLVI